MPSLTHLEATNRAAAVDVREYEVSLDLTAEGETFRSRTVLRFGAGAGSTFVDFEPVEIVSATLNGIAVPVEALADHRLALTGLAAENELVVEAVMRYSNTGEGLHKYTDPEDKSVYLYQHMFLDGARRIFPCFDQPDLKATFHLDVTAPSYWLVAANAALESPVENGHWRFAATKPISTYLVTLIAGPYHRVTDEHDGIPLVLYGRHAIATHLEAQAEEIFTVTKQCLDRYHEMFDIPYPFGHYQQAFVPEFNFGAMENPGLVIFRDEFIHRSAVTESQRELRASVIAHEMAHMWFGDLVTMAWWDDLWLNESFAEYMGSRITAEATAFTKTWTTFAMQRKAWGLRADQHPSTHPVAPADVADTHQALLNFDGISYAKGASVLRQLVVWMGDESFRKGLNEHFAAHAYGNATLADLLAALSKAGGRDLTAWAEVWLRRAQVNTLRVEVSRDGANYAEVAIVQTAPADYPTLRPHKVALGLYDRSPEGTVVRRERVEVDVDPAVDGGRTPVPALTGVRAADLLLLNEGDLTYAKIRLDEQSTAAVPMILPLVGDSLARAVLWAATLDAVVDAERPVAELVTLVLAALPVESEVVIVEDVLRTARSLVDRYATATARPAALELVAQAADRLLAASEPAGSRQLAAARGLIGATVDATRLTAWLAGDGVPEGLTIDDDLRWLIIYRLTVLGAAGRATIEEEFDRDRSSIGEQWAARCRAALPDAESKAAAWAAIVGDASLSNRMAELTATGFWQPEQLDLLTPYVQRYFADMPQMMRVRSGMSAEKTAIAAYPSLVIDPETRRQAAELLAIEDLDPILRRVVEDADDDVRRALAARFLP
jgi:aminopeptidase N